MMINNTILIAVVSITIFVIWFLLTSKKRKFKRDLKKKVLQDGNKDYKGTVTNIIASITKSKSLYKKLIIQVHPDRFLDDKKIIAEELSSRITKSKKDYSQLCQLEIEVNDFLKV